MSVERKESSVMNRRTIKGESKRSWIKNPEEILSDYSGKYRELVGIPRHNIHDFTIMQCGGLFASDGTFGEMEKRCPGTRLSPRPDEEAGIPAPGVKAGK